jgi:hypothetical protein
VLAHRRVFFGHQSVGTNIMEGVTDLLRERPALGLRVVPGDSAADGGAVFAHALVGRNGEPVLKTDAFASLLESGLGARVDVAFHKYCFVDFTPATDAAAVFAHYRATMARLRSEFPGVVFVHVTAPLVTTKVGGIRLALQRLVGRPPHRVQGNFVRERFNELMRREYAGHEPVFDLAGVESTRPDGSREGVEIGGRTAYALVPDYSTDGAHLNPVGRRRVAEALLVFLAELPAQRTTPSVTR